MFPNEHLFSTFEAFKKKKKRETTGKNRSFVYNYPIALRDPLTGLGLGIFP